MCITPINLKKETWKQKLSDTYAQQQVPCGRCIECRKLRVNSWFIRLHAELRNSSSAHFLTLTYDDENLPYSLNGLMDLSYRDTQLFWKDLRYRHSLRSKEKIKYFLAGEYGEQSHRPHYHAIVYNISDVNDIEKAWNKGQIHVGKAEEASIYYTLKYALKSAGKIKKSDPFDDRTIERALMSKGLGIGYLTNEMVKYHKEDVERGVTMAGNKKLPLPRYYRDKIFTQGEKQLRNFKMQNLNESRFDTTADKLFPQRVQKMYADQEKKQKKTD